MAATGSRTGSEALLQAAIGEVRETVRRWLWLLLGLGLMATLLALGVLMTRLFLIAFVAYTHDEASLRSAVVYWTLATVGVVALGSLQAGAVARIARYAAERLAVPAVLATAQRAGRPETLANQAIREVETIRATLSGQATSVLLHAVLTPVYLAFAFAIHWALGVVSLAFCALAAVVSLLVTRARGRAAALGGEDRARAFGLAADAMRAGEAVLAMGMLPRLVREWIAVGTASAAEAWQHERRASLLRSFLDAVMSKYRLILIITGTALMLAGEERSFWMIGCTFVLMRIPEPFALIGEHSQDLAEGFGAWRRLRALVRASPAPSEGLAFPCPRGRLVAERLSFGFRGPQPPLFRGLDLAVEPGEVVGIVGASGSGKSTLLRLLIGMYAPGGGGVYLDGQATHQWDRQALARHVGFLPQEPLLSRGSAAEVIARLEEPDMDLVLDAARRAGAHEAIVGLPLGYATPLAGGHQLSTGQRHRIALARALYGRPRLLVLDELAASLDAEGEAHVARLLAALREEGSAVVFTTHRPALLAVADRVLALRGGVLVPAAEEPAPRLARPQPRLARAPEEARA
ncbi:ATP-binding cassette domain-containing protein [Crenalkalicoccus roseus]|uniref:ATP-binding cassette domain-containing protein n=1 Tax=Crenalkalicoccus roseus TaxID=1485588 RepID=UPI0010808183|nr:ATP-binding cassette domain-containing protein [Crenalkalicoccus roseus]